MSESIHLPNWYQLDFEIKKTHKFTLKLVVKLITLLKDFKLISKWFFLYEKEKECNQTIRLRFYSMEEIKLKEKVSLFTKDNTIDICKKHPFDNYKEDKELFKTEKTVETFANIMYEVSELNINKLREPTTITFSNYYLVERLIHCIYNNIYGGSARNGYLAYYFFLLKLMSYEYKDIAFEENLEATILDDNIDYFEKDEQHNIKILIPRKKKISKQI